MNKKMLQQAQAIQQRLVQAQEELSGLTVEASAGGGVIVVTITADQKLQSIKINPEILSPSDSEEIEDLVLAAINDGLDKSRKAASDHMSKLTGGLNIPGLSI